MARKRKKRGNGFDIDISDGLKQSVLAILLGASAVIFLLSFFNLAGSVGELIDQILFRHLFVKYQLEMIVN